MENLLMLFVWSLAGLVLGGLGVWLVMRAKVQHEYHRATNESAMQLATLTERLAGKEQELASSRKAREELASAHQNLQKDLKEEVSQRSVAEGRLTRIVDLQIEIQALKDMIADLQSVNLKLTSQLSETETRRDEQKTSLDSQLALLGAARQEFTQQFKVLANEILEDKSKRFTQENKANLDLLLVPLGKQISEFKDRVEQTYESESQQRVSLRDEIEKLRTLNARMDKDAIDLTNALKGQSKTLGNWGEFILEEILTKAGLIKDREYSIRETLIAEDGRRSQPDVLIMLPENRHLVIDSKLNLAAYLKHCSTQNDAECELELRKHIAAIRVHLKELDLKSYQDHYKLNSLDFVLMFVPLEPAFIVAVRRDPTLFDDAFAKRIVIVCPSTLLATMRTVRNIWRQEDQKRNVLEIANRSGALYDKFVGFVEDLKDVGVKLRQTQALYDEAQKKLSTGKGNLISRAEVIRNLGAKASKRLPSDLVDLAMEGEEELKDAHLLITDSGLQPLLPEGEPGKNLGEDPISDIDLELYQ